MRTTIDPNSPPAVHNWTGPTGVKFRDVREPSGTYYHDTTPRAVIDGLETAMRSGERVRFWLGDRETGKSWHDEYDVTGTVSRSMGPIKTALLMAARLSWRIALCAFAWAVAKFIGIPALRCRQLRSNTRANPQNALLRPISTAKAHRTPALQRSPRLNAGRHSCAGKGQHHDYQPN